MNGDTTRDVTGSTGGAPPASHAALPKGTHLQEFEVVQVIGEGGFGIVYLADDLLLHRAVAVKEYMPASLASRGEGHSVVARSEQNLNTFQAGMRSFISEARMLAQFKHPALVEVFRFWEQNGTAYMAMPYYKGRTLRQVLQNDAQSVDERWLKILFAPLMDALELMHAQNIYHRDVAPDNILILGNGAPVLLDLGAARRIIGDLTQAVTVVLKPGYAPVEQYADDGSSAQGPWTDIYALGAVMYFAITGRAPAASVSRIMKDTLKPLDNATYPNFSESFLAGIGSALAVKPEDRPQSIAELRALLDIPSYAATTMLPPSQSASSARRALAADAALGGTGAASVTPQPAVTPVETADTPTRTAEPMSAQAEAARALDDLLSESPGKETTLALVSGVAAHAVPEATAGALAASAPGIADAAAGARAEPARPSPDAPRKSPVAWLIGLGAAVLALGLGVAFWPGSEAEKDTGNAPPSTAPPSTAPNTPPESVPSPSPAASPAPRVAPQAAAEVPATAQVAPPARPAAPDRAPAPSAEAPRPPPVPTTAQGAAATDTPAGAVAEGRVRFSLSPWGEVWVNGVKRGASPPLKMLKLPVGEHRIELRNPGFQKQVLKIRVNKGETVAIEHQFVGEPGQGFNSY